MDNQASIASTETLEERLIKEGHELIKNGKIDEAEAKFDRAKMSNKTLAEAWYGKAKIAQKKQNKSVAIQYLNKALKNRHNHEPSLVLKIQILLLSGGENRTKAKEMVKQIDEGSESLNKWLDCLHEKKIFSEIVITDSRLDILCSPPNF